MKNTADVLMELAQPSNITIHSSPNLVRSVNSAAREEDGKRAKEKKQEGKDSDPLRRKPKLLPVPVQDLGRAVRMAPWDVLHSLASATALSRRGAGRGLAEHWGSLKYSQALAGRSPGNLMGLSEEGRATADYYKMLQSRELGFGFALALTRRMLERRYPDYAVSVVPADIILRAGWVTGAKDRRRRTAYPYRPQFFAEIWKPGEPSRVFPVACKGNHTGASTSYGQLASASAHAEAVHIGTWNETPCVIFSSEFRLDGPLTIHVLHASGRDGWLAVPEDSPHSLIDQELADENIFPGISPPTGEQKTPPEREPGYHVAPEHYTWFQHALGRADAGRLTAFCGHADATFRYLTKRQGQNRYVGFSHPTTGSVPDARRELLGRRFAGTDHVFRLNRQRVEAFSGMSVELFDLLVKGELSQYRRAVHARRDDWPGSSWDPDWGGPVSVHADGTAFAIRKLRA